MTRTDRRSASISLLPAIALALLSAGCGADTVDLSSDASARISSAATLRTGGSPNYRVPSGSMEPTLPIGTRVTVNYRPPTVGAVVIFHPPEGAEAQECGPTPHTVSPGGPACDAHLPKKSNAEFIKRIVAGPGDEIYVRMGHVYRKTSSSDHFVREPDPYIRACGTNPECNFPVAIKIPAGQWFMLGDNRGESDDSRFYGPVPTSWIVGTATNYVLRPPYGLTKP
jgi:signal peptidase I